MRCLLFTDTIQDVNGVARFVRTLAAWARASRHELVVVSSSVKPRGAWAEEANIEVFGPVMRMRLPGYGDLDLAVPPLLRMLERAREFGPDCVHVSTPGPVGIAGVWVAQRIGVPLAGTWHTNFPEYVERISGSRALGEIAAEGLALFYQNFELALARSAASLGDMRSAGIRRVRTFRPGVDLERFSPRWKRREIWSELGLDPARPKVVYVGRVSVEKSLALLAAAVRGVDADVVIVGDGPYRVRMERELPEATFAGFQHGERLATIYASSDMIVFPSATETLGQVALEAQASGVSVVVSDRGGPVQFVKDGETGAVVREQTADAWRNCISGLLAEPVRLREMGTAGAEWMRQFSIEASCADFWQAHIDLVDQLRARRA